MISQVTGRDRVAKRLAILFVPLLLLVTLCRTGQVVVAQDSAVDRANQLLRWFGGLELPDVKGREFVRIAIPTTSLEHIVSTQYDYGFVIDESGETFTTLGVNLLSYGFQKGRTLRMWSSPVRQEPAKLDEYARSFLKYRDRRTRDDKSDYNIMQFGSLSDCTEAVVLAWACERNDLHDLAMKLIARAEREARKPESLYFAPHIPTWESLEAIVAREKKKYATKLTLRQIVERDVSRIRAAELLSDFRLPEVVPREHLSRRELLARLEQFIRLFPECELAEPCRAAIDVLRGMMMEDEQHARVRVDGLPFAQLARDEQIAELIFQLRDQRGGSIDTPECFVFMDKADSPAHKLTRYGFDAVPQLNAALDDTNLTWSVGFGKEFLFTDRVLRVGDCAEQILAAIAGRRTFAEHVSRGAELMQGDNAERVREAVQEWFAAAKQKGELRVLSEGVAKGGYDCHGQAEILALKYGESALEPIRAGVQARTQSPWMQWELLQLVHRVPGEQATAYLIEEARRNPNWVSRFVAAWGLHQRGRAEGVDAMLALWDADEPQTSDDSSDLSSVNNSIPTSEVIWFLLRCGKVNAIEAVRAKLESREDRVIEQAILDIAFDRDTYYGGSNCRPADAPQSVRDDPKEVRLTYVQLLAGFLELKSAVLPYGFGQAESWDKWREDARICDFAAAALHQLEPNRFTFDLSASLSVRDLQIEKLKAETRASDE